MKNQKKLGHFSYRNPEKKWGTVPMMNPKKLGHFSYRDQKKKLGYYGLWDHSDLTSVYWYYHLSHHAHFH